MIMLTAFFSLLTIIGAIILAKRSRAVLPPVDAEYLKFCRFMERQGYPRKIGEGPLDYAVRIGSERPDLKAEVDAITAMYVQMNYIDTAISDAEILRKAVRGLRFRTLTANA